MDNFGVNSEVGMKIFCIPVLAVCLFAPFSSGAATDKDVDRMTTYAVLLGRGMGCGLDVSNAANRVGSWMDRTFPPGSREQAIYFPIFMEGMKYHADMQKSGKSPDSCNSVKNVFVKTKWP